MSTVYIKFISVHDRDSRRERDVTDAEVAGIDGQNRQSSGPLVNAGERQAPRNTPHGHTSLQLSPRAQPRLVARRHRGGLASGGAGGGGVGGRRPGGPVLGRLEDPSAGYHAEGLAAGGALGDRFEHLPERRGAGRRPRALARAELDRRADRIAVAIDGG